MHVVDVRLHGLQLRLQVFYLCLQPTPFLDHLQLPIHEGGSEGVLDGWSTEIDGRSPPLHAQVALVDRLVQSLELCTYFSELLFRIIRGFVVFRELLLCTTQTLNVVVVKVMALGHLTFDRSHGFHLLKNPFSCFLCSHPCFLVF